VYFCYNYSYFKNFTRSHLISKHNILNFFEVENISQVDIVFALKNNKRECGLLLFWVIFVLVGRKPLVLKTFSGFKKNKFKFIIRLKRAAFVNLLRIFSVFILASHEKRARLILKQEQSSYFCIFKGTYLAYLDTFCFYNYIGNQDLKFLLENLYLVFKFKSKTPEQLKTALSSLQLPITNDTKRNDFANTG
jgi:hypothetical protein